MDKAKTIETVELARAMRDASGERRNGSTAGTVLALFRVLHRSGEGLTSLDGHSWLTATTDEYAELLGLSPRQIAYAIARLEDMGLIERRTPWHPPTRGTRNYIRPMGE